MRYSDLVSPLWFRHESPYDLNLLRPLTYDELREVRPDYDVDARMETELAYKELIEDDPANSFLYATICGFNKMEAADDYPGYTYFFQLTAAQIEQCLFGVVDEVLNVAPQRGATAMRQAMRFWVDKQNQMIRYEDPEVGLIDPRIEVIIPFAVVPTRYVPQVEDR